jgi:pimeloyl-ACP methyl ester carboxylesterase
MDYLTPHRAPPEYLTRIDGVRIAFRCVSGDGPCIVFLPGYMSDMMGSKAMALDAWAIRNNRAFLRFDYSGCGESEGDFADGTLDLWCHDVLQVIRHATTGPVVLIGSSMGGWLALMVAETLKTQVSGLIGLAAAPDFTDWGFDDAAVGIMTKHGHLEQPSDYGPEPVVTTLRFWQSGAANRMLDRTIAIDCPVRLIQGQADADVPWQTALRLAQRLRSSDVQLTLIKNGDHRLSRPSDIELLLATVKQLPS